MLLVASEDGATTIWNVPSDIARPFTPHVSLEGHEGAVYGGAFLGDDAHVITGSVDRSLRVWRTSDGVQTANYDCGGKVCHAFSIIVAHSF